jgi:hypothetical protein
MHQKVKEEVENALLIIMDKKYKAEQEVVELKKLLRERNQKIYELEEENKQLKNRHNGHDGRTNEMSGRPRDSMQQDDNMHMAMQSQDAEGFDRAEEEPVYDQPPSQDDEDDFWQEGKQNKAGYGGDNDLWIMGNKSNMPPANNNASYGATGASGQPPGFKSIPKRPQGYNANDDMAFYGVAAKKR